jgi:hypothetical protein
MKTEDNEKTEEEGDENETDSVNGQLNWPIIGQTFWGDSADMTALPCQHG